MEPREIAISTTPFRHAAKRWGRPDGPPVLALHGWLDSAASFDLLAPRLADVDLVALDLLGHGFSEVLPPGTVHHLLDRVVDVVEVIEALGWERPAIVGHSLGAGIAAHLAGAFPSHVSRLVLIEGLGALSREPQECPAALRDSYLAEKALAAKRRQPATRAAEDLIGIIKRTRGLDDGPARVLAARAIEMTADGARFRHDLRCELPPRDRLVESQVMAYLMAISCPVLLFMAKDNQLLREPRWARAFEARCAAVKELTLRRIDGGHYPHMVHPELLGREVAAFLSATPPSPLPA